MLSVSFDNKTSKGTGIIIATFINIRTMRMLFLICLCFSATLSASMPYHANRSCRYTMAKHNLTGRFPGAVAHGIHSITLEDIRFYFKSDATEGNFVPTLNYDLKDERTVLPNAPLYGFDTSFTTVAMRYVDQVLMNMDKKDYYLTGYTTLERLVHTLHMGDVWAKTKIHYDRLSMKKFNDQHLCKCVNDIQKNAIMKMLSFVSLKIRFPGITSGMVDKLPDGNFAEWSGNIYTYHFKNWPSDGLRNFNIQQDENGMLKQASEDLVDGDKGMKHLTNEKVWQQWKNGIKSMIEHDNYELAVFLYCRLN